MIIWIIDEEWRDYDLEIAYLTERFPGVEIKISNYDYANDLEDFGYRADGILAQVYADIPRSTIEKLECCKGIAVYGGGFDRVDVESCKEKGIMVTNIQGYCVEDIADYTVAAMYHFNKKIAMRGARVLKDVKANKWGALAVEILPHRLSEQVLLIIGFGTIGQGIAKLAKSIGVRVCAYDEFIGKDKMDELGVECVTWDEGLRNADYVSINLKGCEENRDKINATTFEIMKTSAYIINTARGKIVNEADLIKAVKDGQIAGAMLDVIENEPGEASDPILNCEGIVVTPHISYISVESFLALKTYALENLTAMLSGKTPRDSVY